MVKDLNRNGTRKTGNVLRIFRVRIILIVTFSEISIGFKTKSYGETYSISVLRANQKGSSNSAKSKVQLWRRLTGGKLNFWSQRAYVELFV